MSQPQTQRTGFSLYQTGGYIYFSPNQTPSWPVFDVLKSNAPIGGQTQYVVTMPSNYASAPPTITAASPVVYKNGPNFTPINLHLVNGLGPTQWIFSG
ncbi:hypothetical protein FGLOB1_10576 [Fusarium globosum]|uniref:Uncharacterized protein n=1 Tax=Fusarium globosum TaxID=78864 RepID=A0A8H6D256_9HYPO|nr:hypothetical protein FGLOB1_10576 [Fusarium globosum]KLO92838.1 Uncharacterized protein LW93_3992 [Fusarium fujikuroi]